MSHPDSFHYRLSNRRTGRGPAPCYIGLTSAMQRKNRRAARKHAAKMFAAGCPEKAAVWLKRARNG